MTSTQTGDTNQKARIARNFDGMADFLMNHNIRPTRQRVAIASHIFEKEQHLSADTILERVNADESATYASKATVYNTLHLFVKKGILKEVALDSQKVIFDTNMEHHHHILNVDSGEIKDITPVAIDLSGVPGIQQEQNVSSVDLIITVNSQDPE